MSKYEKENTYTDVQVLKQIRDLLDTSRSAFGDIVAESLRVQSGWLFNYNLNPVFVNVDTSNGGSVIHEDVFAKLSTGTDPDGYAEVNTKRLVTYTPGIGAVARFTNIFAEPEENLYQFIGIGNHTDGWYFGYKGLEFGIMRYNDSVEFWIPQSQWNCWNNPDFVPQKGNVFQISFQYLGFGDQYFYMEDDKGNLSLVHQIQYPNRYDKTSVQNPSFPITAKIYKVGGSANDISMKTPSAVGGSYGEIDSSAFEFPVGYDQTDKAISANVETYLFSIRNPDTYLSVSNRLYTLPILSSFSSDGTKSVIIRVYFNATVSGGSWVDLAPGITPLQYNEGGSWTGGLKVLTLTLGKVDRDSWDLSSIRGLISPGGVLTFTAISTGGSDITSAVTFKSRV